MYSRKVPKESPHFIIFYFLCILIVSITLNSYGGTDIAHCTEYYITLEIFPPNLSPVGLHVLHASCSRTYEVLITCMSRKAESLSS